MIDDAHDLLIAGLRFRVASADAATRAAIAARLPEFHAPRAGAPDVTLHLAFSDELPNRDLAGSDALVERRDARGRVVVARRADFDGTHDRDSGEARCTYASDLGSLYSFLRIVASFAVLDRGGVLLHASSVVSQGRAFVFAGPSGTGKTTIARAGAPRPVLSDEVTAIVPEPSGALVCHPTPFWGDMVRVRAGERAPFRVLGFPVHASADPATGLAPAPRITPASRSDSFARLLECAIAFDLTRSEKEALLEVVKGIVSVAICLHVEYALEYPPWELLDAVVPPA